MRLQGLPRVCAAILLLVAAALPAAAASPPCYTPSSGLVSWWGGEGSAVDQMGTNNGALINGASFGAGEVGQAFSFSGNSQCVDIPYSTNLVAPAYSLEVWVKPLANGPNQTVIVGQSFGWQMVARHGSSGLYVSFMFATSYTSFHEVLSSSQIPVGQFSHLVGTWDGTTLKLYINGVLNAQATPGVSPVDPGEHIYIGGYDIQSGPHAGYAAQFFNGLIDEASYYSRALAGSEVLALYNAGSSGKCGPGIPPSIQTQPASRTVAVGANVNFSVAASGNTPLSFQWHLNGGDITGATSSALSLTNVQTTDAGTYDVAVTNLYGATNSLGATLTVLTPPQIATQPQDEAVAVGSNALFTVSATGSDPLNYQWYFNGTAVSGATGTSLAVNGVSAPQLGAYWVSVSNQVGGALSRHAILTWQPSGSCSPPPSGLVSWWAAEGTAADQMAVNNGSLANGAGFNAGEVGQAFSFNGSGQYVFVPYSASLTAPTYSVEAWVNPLTQPHNDISQYLIVGQAFGWQIVLRRGTSGMYVAFEFGTSYTSFYEVLSSSQIPLGQFSHVVGTWDGTTLSLYINGVLSASTVPGASPVDSGEGVYIGGYNVPNGLHPAYVDQFFNGLIDEASYYNRSLVAAEVQTLFLASSAGKCGVPTVPSIQAQPQSRTVVAGTNVTFSVAAAGSGPLNYQWHFNGTDIAGATAPVLVLTNVQAASAGTYEVAVTNTYGATNSLGAILAVLAAPQITSQPQDETVTVGSNATFSVTATGDAPLAFQWYFDGALVAGATNSSLALSGVSFSQGGIYQVSVSNAVGMALSRSAMLFVQSGGPCVPPPAGLVSWWAAEGSSLDQVGTNNGALIKSAGFATGEVGQAFSLNGSNQCVDIPYSASLVSPTYSLEAWIKPLAQPNNDLGQDVIAGQAFGWQMVVRHGSSGVYVAFLFSTSYTSFHEVASSSQIPIGQFSHLVGTWDGTTLSLYVNGALSAQATPGVSPVDSGDDVFLGGYDVQSGPHAGYVAQFFKGLIDEASYYGRALTGSEVQALFNAGSTGKCSTPTPPSLQTQPQSLTVALGASASFSVGAAGTGPLNFQWHFNGADIPGATAAVLKLDSVQLTNAGTYDVAVTNLYGATNSLGATLAVLSPPQITTQPQDETVSTGSDALVTVTATGTDPLFYQWYFNGAALPGATNSSLALSAVSPSQGGAYRVAVSNTVGMASSRRALLFVQSSGPCATPPDGLISWWAAEGDPTDQVGTNNGVLVNGASFGTGEVGQAFSLNGTNQCVDVAYSSSLVASNYSLETWIEPLAQVHNDLGQDLIVGQAFGWQMVVRHGSSGLRVAFLFSTSYTSFHEVLSTSQIPIGQFSHLVGTWDGTNLSLYINGALNAQAAPGISPVDSGEDVYVGGYDVQAGPHAGYMAQFFNGLIDEASYYGRALSASEVQALYNAGSAGKCGTSVPPPAQMQVLGRMAPQNAVLANNPSCQLENLGGGAVRVTCAGQAGLTYRFQQSTNLFLGGWVDVGSATADQLGGCQFVDHPPANAPMRFYRAVTP